MVNINLILNSYSCILERYLELTDNKPNRRFLNNRPWLTSNYERKEDMLSYIKMPYEIYDDELVAYCKKLSTDLDGVTKSVLVSRISAIESKIIANKKTYTENKSNAPRLSVISSVEMENVRGTMQSLKSSNVGLIVEKDNINGDKYYIGGDNELTNSIISKNRDSQVTVSIKRELSEVEVVDEYSRQSAVKELNDSLLNLNAEVDMMWVILCDNFIKQLENGTLTKQGEATLTYDEIHFKFRGKAGKNNGSTLSKETAEKYTRLIRVLSSFKANIRLNTKSMKAYYNFSKNTLFKSNDSYSIDSNIINSNFIYKETDNNGILNKKVIGLKYNLDLLGKLYLTETKMINANVPAIMLGYDMKKNSPAYNIFSKVVYLANVNKKEGFDSAKFTLQELIDIARFEYKVERKSQYIKKFINLQVKKALDDAIEEQLIKSYDIPNEKELNMKYLDSNIIKIYF